MSNKKYPDSHPHSQPLEARLRALPQPRVPDDLERRLLSAIATRRSAVARRRLAWVGGCGAFAAACLLMVFARPGSDAKKPPAHDDQAPRWAAASQPASHIMAEGRTEPIFDSSKPPKFAWPLAGVRSIAASRAIRDVLLD